MLKDYTGKDIKAVEVLEQSIRSQVENFLHLIQCRKESDVKYVFTVPTHSDDSIQQLIIEAALRVSIFDEFIHRTCILRTFLKIIAQELEVKGNFGSILKCLTDIVDLL